MGLIQEAICILLTIMTWSWAGRTFWRKNEQRKHFRNFFMSVNEFLSVYFFEELKQDLLLNFYWKHVCFTLSEYKSSPNLHEAFVFEFFEEFPKENFKSVLIISRNPTAVDASLKQMETFATNIINRISDNLSFTIFTFVRVQFEEKTS